MPIHFDATAFHHQPGADFGRTGLADDEIRNPLVFGHALIANAVFGFLRIFTPARRAGVLLPPTVEIEIHRVQIFVRRLTHGMHENRRGIARPQIIHRLNEQLNRTRRLYRRQGLATGVNRVFLILTDSGAHRLGTNLRQKIQGFLFVLFIAHQHFHGFETRQIGRNTHQIFTRDRATRAVIAARAPRGGSRTIRHPCGAVGFALIGHEVAAAGTRGCRGRRLFCAVSARHDGQNGQSAQPLNELSP